LTCQDKSGLCRGRVERLVSVRPFVAAIPSGLAHGVTIRRGLQPSSLTMRARSSLLECGPDLVCRIAKKNSEVALTSRADRGLVSLPWRAPGRGHTHDEPALPKATARRLAPSRGRSAGPRCRGGASAASRAPRQGLFRANLFYFGPFPLVLLWRPSSKEVHATPPPCPQMPPAQRRSALSNPPQWWTRSSATGSRPEKVPDLSETGDLADRSTSDPRASRV